MTWIAKIGMCIRSQILERTSWFLKVVESLLSSSEQITLVTFGVYL